MIEAQEITADSKSLKSMFVRNTEVNVLFIMRRELRKQIDILDGNEEVVKASRRLFDKGFYIISSEDSLDMDLFIWVISKAFVELTLAFKKYLYFEGEFDGNIYQYVKQLIRYVDFVKRLEGMDNEDFQRKILLGYLKEITYFIFSQPEYRVPNLSNGNNSERSTRSKDEKYSSKDEKHIKNLKYLRKLNADKWQNAFFSLYNCRGYETYYAAGLSEMLKTMSNKERHPYAYPRNFEEQLNFYLDFSQVISIYNLAIYSFIELLEGWSSVKPFIEGHIEDLTKWKREKNLYSH